MKFSGFDVNRVNCNYFSKGAQLAYYKEEFFELLPAEKDLFLKHIRSGQSVLDIGCGAGRTTSHIKLLTENVIGIDLSEALIGAAREKFPSMDFRVMDAVRMDFPDNLFDVLVFSYNGLCYVHPEEKRMAAIDEIKRVLKPGGVYIFSSFNRFYPLALYALLNLTLTKIILGFSSNYRIHVTRHGITVNYETSPEEETTLFQSMGFELIEQVPMTERVGMWGYKPAVLTYYAFRKL
ncbi:MAG: methyltransferase domain-containing protein [Desulfuromonadales bacterium]|nr:methyltransferase domain-containing protein [Desulfuromonadales bacterium]